MYLGGAYKYTPLNENDIRLLQIVPAKDDEETIQIKLIHVDIGRCPNYQLLTFTWGNPDEREMIICNEGHIEVIRSVYSALRSLRRSKSTFILFVDMICINQADDHEKSTIIGGMTRILGQAVRTILWVGEESENTNTAFEIIKKLSRARRSEFGDKTAWELGQKQPVSVLERYRTNLSSASSGEWRALEDILERRIFHRSWTLEDIVFSRELSLRCGGFEITWNDFCYGLEGYSCCSLRTECRHPGLESVLGLNHLRAMRLSESRATPDHVLEIVRDLTATDRRDKVYAAISTIDILGLGKERKPYGQVKERLNEGGILSRLKQRVSKSFPQKRYKSPSAWHERHLRWMTVDYKQAWGEIIRDAAIALNTNSTVPVLPFSSLSMVADDAWKRAKGGGSDEHDLLRSWVPDWNVSHLVYRLNTTESKFMASKGGPGETVRYSAPWLTHRGVVELKTGLSDRNEAEPSDIMIFSGLVVDRVAVMANYLPPRRPYDKYNTSGANSIIWLEWMELAQESSGPKYKTQRDRLLLDWIETIQAKCCTLWHENEPHVSETLLTIAKSWLNLFEDETQEVTHDILEFHAACLPSYGRKFGITKRGNFCLIPRYTERNDLVTIPFGSKVPFIFRKIEDYYLNIGECYVHGAMQGEALAWEDNEEVEFDLR